MKALYLDCTMGAAGDMLTAALYELLSDAEKDRFLKKMNSLGLEGSSISAEKAIKCGITGTHMKVIADGMEEDEHIRKHHHDHEHDHEHHHDNEHHHDHDHEHHHGHSHSSLSDIESLIESFGLDEKTCRDAIGVYSLIAEAESRVHDTAIDQIHFHEVGTKDAVMDVTAVCLLMNELKPDRILASPICVGSGEVHCAHGILPVPAPATAYILKDIPVYAGKIRSELCTPTGAALLKYFVSDFCDMPVMKISSTGYGMGKKDFEKANCIRAFWGDIEADGYDELVTVLSCNVDDMTGEEVGFAIERFLEEGASEAFTVPVNMKKSRPGVMIEVICSKDDTQRMIELIFKYTTTIGVRQFEYKRNVLGRRIEKTVTGEGEVRYKVSEGYGVRRSKYEFEDLSRIARENNISLWQARELVEKEKVPTKEG